MKRQAANPNPEDVRRMKAAYDRFIHFAAKLSKSRLHAAHLLETNSAYNQFLKAFSGKKEGDPS